MTEQEKEQILRKMKNRVRQSTLDFSEPAKKRQKSIKFSPF